MCVKAQRLKGPRLIWATEEYALSGADDLNMVNSGLED